MNSSLPPVPKEQSDRMKRALADVVERSKVLTFTVHGDDSEGNVDLEFRSVYLAVGFLTDRKIHAGADIRQGDTVRSFTDPVVVTFNLYDYAKRNNIA